MGLRIEDEGGEMNESAFTAAIGFIAAFFMTFSGMVIIYLLITNDDEE